MSRSRVVVWVSSGAVALGVAVAAGALVLGTSRAGVGPLPAEALLLLPGARYVMGLDVARFMGSAFHKRYAHDPSSRPRAFGELEAKTGLNPERDVDRVFLAGGAPGDKQGVVLVLGRFDRARVTQAIENQQKDVTHKDVHGTTVYVFREESKSPGAVAILDDKTILIGAQLGVEGVITSHALATGKASVGITDLLARVKPGTTFWMVGDETLLANLPKAMPSASSTTSFSLPALKGLVVTGDLDPDVSLSIVGDTADAPAATNVANMVRGLVSFASLQANQKPEFARLASSISVTTEAAQVHVEARLPYELLDVLAPHPRAADSAPGVAPPAKP